MESLNVSLNFKSVDQISTIKWNKCVTNQVDPYLYMSLSEKYWTAHSRRCSCLSWELFHWNPTGMNTYGNFDHSISNIKCHIFVAKKQKTVVTEKIITF